MIDHNLQINLLDNAVAFDALGIVVGTSALVGVPEPSFAFPIVLSSVVALLRRRKVNFAKA